MLWQTHLLLNTPAPTYWLCGFVFSSTVFAYNFTAPPRRRWPAWGFGLLAVFCFLELTIVHQLTVFLPALIWLMYYDRYRPGHGTGLRDYPALKPIAISLAWAGVTVLLPVPLNEWTGTMPLFVGRAAFIFALALAYDLSDQPYDIQHGLNTLVLKIGPRQAFRLIDAALLLTALCAGTLVLLDVFELKTWIAICISLLFSAFAIRWILAWTGWPGWRKAGIDGLMVLQFVLIWISLQL